jgi:hypothetical protein
MPAASASEAAVGDFAEYPLRLAAMPANSSAPDKTTAGNIFMGVSLWNLSIADREMIVATAHCRHRPGFPPIADSFLGFAARGERCW